MDKPTPKKVGRFNVLVVPQLPDGYPETASQNAAEGTDDNPGVLDDVKFDSMSSSCAGCVFDRPLECDHPQQRMNNREGKECWMTSLMFLPVKRWEWYMKHRVIAASQGYELLTVEEARKRLP